ncbi:MAG: hypothetical protein D6718_08225 [Acidobacteria bacterium]|nr:MAG: hypothetical protein D6718_08225 [Acidobacteriota bacterium]
MWTQQRVKKLSSATSLISVAVLVVIANYLGAKHYVQWDWTAGGLYTLSQRTELVLEQLDRPVRFVSFLVPEEELNPDAVEQIHVLLEAYRAANPGMVSVEIIDPRRDPARTRALLNEFDLDPLTDATDIVMVASGDRRKQVRLDEMLEYDEGGFGLPGGVKSLTAEAALTGAVVAVTRSRRPLVQYAVGHGERPMRGGEEGALGHFIEALEREDTEIVEWDALGAEAVPEGTDLVIVAGPSQPWLAPERDALGRYLESGGAALILLEPTFRRAGGGNLVPSGLEPVLKRWGLTPREDIVIDPAATVPLVGAETFFADISPDHPSTRNLGSRRALFTLARSIAMDDPPPEGVVLTALVSSTGEAWSEQDLDALSRRVERDDDEPRGPLPVVVAAERREGEEAGGTEPQGDEEEAGSRSGRGGRMIVAGDVDFLLNGSLDQLSNRALALNLAEWLLEGDRRLGIPPKERTLTRLFLTADQLYLELLPLLVLVIPLAAVAAGLGVWWRRRETGGSR